jgi:diguanylate cyclase (GGDEF)-like protein
MFTRENELQRALERERTAKLICAELNNFTDLKPTLETILINIKSVTNCQAVGVRLHDEGDYPYYVYTGFSPSFIAKENSLGAKDDKGNRICSQDGTGYLLECMCGNIICGRFDTSLPFFTAAGSFWSNNTSALLASTTEKERQSRTRNYCNSCGYESVALIPIKAKGETIGLIQLNDKKTDMFTLELIEFMEMIGHHIGLSVQNSLMYDKLKRALEEAEILREELCQQAIRDPLTKLFNRRYMEETFECEIKRSIRSQYTIGIVMFDIDHFKYVNDGFGHAAGDTVLSQLGQLILMNIRGSDVACRYGGEEFVLILPESSHEDALRKAEQLREKVKLSPWTVHDTLAIDITISLGVAAFPDNGTTASELLQSADAALYRAKQAGRDRVVSVD